MTPNELERNPTELPPYSELVEPRLAFDSTRSDAVETHPLRGLITYGPFSRTSVPTFTPTIRLATVGPRSGRGQVRKLVQSLEGTHQPSDRPEYVQRYPGFSQIFQAGIAQADAGGVHIGWPDNLDGLPGVGADQDRLADAIRAAVAQLGAVRSEFDVAMVHLPDSWRFASATSGFDAHDYLKAQAALAGIPTQVVNDRVFNFQYLASRSWRLAIAQYVKAGGIPWKLAPLSGVPHDTAFIGLAYAFRGDPRQANVVTCCSQVFDADGGGMQFVAYDASDPIDDDEEARHNPYLSRADMRAVLARSLRLYQARNGGSIPGRTVIHKLTPFREEELLGVEDALAAVKEIECLEITTDVAWRAVWLDAPRRRDGRSEPHRFPVQRGTMVPLSGRSALLWGAGDAPSVATRGHFYQGGKSIPRPLLLTRHAGSGPLEIPALEALALTKMDWNNDALYDPAPVTIRYSKRLAQAIARVPSMRNGEYPYRMFM